jgi:hypothetical protein
MPWFAQRFTVKKILLLEVDFRQMLGTLLDLDTTGRARGIASAIMIKREPQFLRGIKQSGVPWNRSASAFGMKKRHQRHPRASFNEPLPPPEPTEMDSASA